MTQTQSKTPAWLAYLAAWITGLIFLAVEKNDQDMRWHAANSLAIFGAIQILLIIIWILPFGWVFTGILNSLIGLGMFVLWIILMYKASKNERLRIPFATDFAESTVINWFK